MFFGMDGFWLIKLGNTLGGGHDGRSRVRQWTPRSGDLNL
jgi:hypothetical protein